MKKILLSLALILVFGTAAYIGGTGAFFSDTETSTNNTFTAGAIDLKIDNTSYYLGVANPGTTWPSQDLTNQKFFDFSDLKPSDYGELVTIITLVGLLGVIPASLNLVVTRYISMTESKKQQLLLASKQKRLLNLL